MRVKAPKQTSLVRGSCSHLGTREEVTNYGGEVIALRCSSCTTVLAHVGKCDGCGRNRALTHHVLRNRTRYCTEDCYRAAQAAKKALERNPWPKVAR